jgi:putative heme-binding domain-containing protein
LSLERRPGDVASRFRIETRVLLRQQGEWAGYSYRWNSEQTDAELVSREGADVELSLLENSLGQPLKQVWRFPNRSECLTCHSRAANFVLGLSEAQLNREHEYGTIRDNQLRTLAHIGMFNSPPAKPPETLATLANPYDATQELEARARAYLHVQCSACHVEAGGGNAQMELGIATSRDRMRLIGIRPQHDTFGIENAMLVAPQDPDHSVLVHRLSRRGPGQMPPLVTKRVDERAVQLLRDWIRQLKPGRPVVREWQMDDLVPLLHQVASGRSFSSGQNAYRDTGCIQCHRLGNEGGTVGPDLNAVSKRAGPREVLESILLPSKVIADEYAGVVIETEGGETITGRVEREDGQVIVVRPVSANESARTIPRSSIASRRRSDISNMPNATANVLTQDEILDLLAYVLSNANRQDARFQ